MTTAGRVGRFAWLRASFTGFIAAVTRPERLLGAVATATFPLALLLPLFTLQPSLGDPLIDAIWEEAQPGSTEPKTYSVISGIGRLYEDGDTVIAFVLLLFSVIFPAAKLTLLWSILFRPKSINTRLLRFLEALGPWSMADVFVVSVMLLAFKSFPGGTSFTVEPGYYLFLTSVVAGMASAWVVGLRQRKSASPQAQEASS